MPIDATRIWGKLYQGGEPPIGGALAKEGFDAVVLAAEEVQPEGWNLPGVLILRVPLRDVPTRMSKNDLRQVKTIALAVATLLEQGRKVLVTCKMGWNRSGLVAAETMILSGVPPLVAIATIRRRRGGLALSNPAFVHALVTDLREDAGRMPFYGNRVLKA